MYDEGRSYLYNLIKDNLRRSNAGFPNGSKSMDENFLCAWGYLFLFGEVKGNLYNSTMTTILYSLFLFENSIHGGDELNELWERQKDETSKSYGYFCTYRDLPYTGAEDRSIRRVCEIHKKMNNRAMEQLCANHGWVERAAAYDNYIDQLVRAKQEDSIVAMKAKHAKLAEDMIDKAWSALKDLDSENINANMVTNMIKAAVEIERLSRGENNEVKPDGEMAGIQIYIPDNKR